MKKGKGIAEECHGYLSIKIAASLLEKSDVLGTKREGRGKGTQGRELPASLLAQ